jgi:hypothetical protein
MTDGFWKTLRDETFATWFGIAIVAAIVVFPLSATIQSCWNDSVREEIETTKLKTEIAGRQGEAIEHIKWLVFHGVHPLVARCTVLNDPAYQCSLMIGDLEEEERTTIDRLLDKAPATFAVRAEDVKKEEPVAPPTNPQDYVKGLDFGLTSPTQ